MFRKKLEYVHEHPEIYFNRKARRSGYVCPVCGNGSDKDGTGVNLIKGQTFRYKCFKCGTSGDVINFYAAEHHLSNADAIIEVIKLYGLDTAGNSSVSKVFDGQSDTVELAEELKFASVIAEDIVSATENLNETYYFSKRGISNEVAVRYNCGFIRNWIHPKKRDDKNVVPSDRVIIPTSVESYVARADLYDTKNLGLILAKCNLNVNYFTIKYLSLFLIQTFSLNEKIIPEIITTKQPGWHGKDFVYPNVAGKYLIDNSFNYSDKFCTAGDKNIWLNTLQDLLADSRITDCAIACTLGTVLAAPLIEPCSARNIQFALIGKSGVGKSALMKFAFSILGNPETLKNTFNSTGNSINDISQHYNDLPQWIDEFQSGGKKISDNIETLIYNFETGKTRLRENRAGEQKEIFYFRGTRSYTGEQFLLNYSSGQGALARIIQLPCAGTEKFIPGELAQKLHRIARDNYGFFGYEWVKFVQAHTIGIKAMYDNLQDTIQAQIKDGGIKDLLPAHIQAIALILTAYCQFLVYLSKEQNFKLPDPYDDPNEFYQEGISELLVTSIAEKLQSADDTTNAQRALKVLQESLISRSKQFMSYNRASETDNTLHKYFESTVQPTLGVILKNGDVGFFPKEITNYLVKDCGFPDATILFAQFHDNDWLEQGNNNNRKYQKSVRIDDKTPWLYVVKKSVINP